jgi:hypothetical protein
MKRAIGLVFLTMLPIVMLIVVGQGCKSVEVFEGARQILDGAGGLSNNDIVNGLKEALQIGTSNAVSTVSKADGYYKDPLIKIPLPQDIQKVETLLRMVGYGQKVDDFELSMNRAAEKAAPEAKSILLNAARQMQIIDAQKILKGPDNAATEYFKEKTSDRILAVFKPIVKDTMNTVGVTRQFEELNSTLSVIPAGQKLSFDLAQYVTEKGLEGLFLVLAQEEKEIRQNPAARTTELLKKVFGYR